MSHYFFQIQSVAIIAQTSTYCAFAAETFFKTGESVIAKQRAFCVHFMLGWNDVPDRIFNPEQHHSNVT